MRDCCDADKVLKLFFYTTPNQRERFKEPHIQCGFRRSTVAAERSRTT